jgi:hypothetical protein
VLLAVLLVMLLALVVLLLVLAQNPWPWESIEQLKQVMD